MTGTKFAINNPVRTVRSNGFSRPVRSNGFTRPFSPLLLLPLLLTLALNRPQPTQARAGTHSIYLPLALSSPCTTYIEQGGLLTFEVESVPPIQQWIIETNLPGYSGDSFYTWAGPDQYTTPGVAILNYPILINTPGYYNFRLHNRHDWLDPSLQNDVFARLDSGEWIKTFSSERGLWTWRTAFDHHTYQGNAEFYLSAGPHTLQLSPRSAGFRIDRILLDLQEDGNFGEDITLPISPCF